MGYQWVKTDYQNIVEAKDDGIISIDPRGAYEYSVMSFTEQGGQERSRKGLLLMNRDLRRSSAAKIKAQPNYRVKLVIQTDNNDYWNDNTDLDWWEDKYVNYSRRDNAYIYLNGNQGDYISVDIDEEFVGIKNLRIYQDGVERSDEDPSNVNNEVRFWIDEIYEWKFVEDEPEETEPINDPDIDSDGDGLPNDVDGDDDNDGVPDGIDDAPLDPDVTVIITDDEDDETEWGKVLGFALILGLIGLVVARYMRGGLNGEE